MGRLGTEALASLAVAAAVAGHVLMGFDLSSVSIFGMIALGGIIVRQSILIVEFVKLEVAQGKEVTEAAIRGAELRMRPIFITSLTLMAGAFAILQDPIFNGMAISLLFGAGVATVMALLVIPLGCISAKKQFYVQTSDDGTVSVSPMYDRIEQVKAEESAPAVYKTPLWMRVYGGVISAFTWLYYIIRAVFTMLGMGFKAILGKFGGGKSTPPPPREPPPAGTPPPPSGGTPPPAPPAEPTPAPVADSGVLLTVRYITRPRRRRSPGSDGSRSDERDASSTRTPNSASVNEKGSSRLQMRCVMTRRRNRSSSLR